MLLLEQAGWKGILVEPSQIAFTELQKNRPNNHLRNIALTSSNQIISLEGTFTSGSLMGSADRELRYRDSAASRSRIGNRIRSILRFNPRIRLIDVAATTVDEVISDSNFQDIDLFVLDVEGYEYEVLKGLGSHRPRVIVIETRLRDFYRISEELLRIGYVLVSNLTQFTREHNPNWSGDHQDYAWCLKKDFPAMSAIIDT